MLRFRLLCCLSSAEHCRSLTIDYSLNIESSLQSYITTDGQSASLSSNKTLVFLLKSINLSVV
jgi:hypothetical protein